MISASMIEPNLYAVTVGGEVETRHQVGMTQEYYRSLCGGTVTHEWVIVQAFQFLLERESNTSILESFDLPDIARYFPEFEADLRERLAP